MTKDSFRQYSPLGGGFGLLVPTGKVLACQSYWQDVRLEKVRVKKRKGEKLAMSWRKSTVDSEHLPLLHTIIHTLPCWDPSDMKAKVSSHQSQHHTQEVLAYAKL